MSAPARDYYSVIICSIRKIWQNPQIAQATTCAIHGFLREVRIHRLRSAIHESGRSTDCAHNIHLSCTVSTSSANVLCNNIVCDIFDINYHPNTAHINAQGCIVLTHSAVYTLLARCQRQVLRYYVGLIGLRM